MPVPHRRLTHPLRRLAGAAALALTLSAVGVAPALPAQAARTAALPPVGSVLCHSGPVSGWQCGTLTAVDLTVVFPGGAVHGLFRYTACAAPGDSGAPVVRADGEQVGTVVAGTGGCAAGGVTNGSPLP